MAFPDNDLQVKVYAYLGADPTDDPSNWPAPVDLTSRLLDRDISLSLGRSPGQRTAAAGQATIWLNNTDGALTPLLATSPYYPDWDLGVPIAVDVDGVGPNPPYELIRGYAAAIEADMVPTVGGGVVSAVKVTVGGILRRLGHAVAMSAVGRTASVGFLTISGSRRRPDGWWPLEAGDERETVSSPPAPGYTHLPPLVAEPASAGPHRLSGVVGGTAVGPPGAAAAIDLSAGGQLRSALPVGGTVGVFRYDLAVMFSEPLGAFDSGQILRLMVDDMAYIGVFARSGPLTGIVVEIFDGSSFTSHSGGSIAVDDGAWHVISLLVTDLGSSIAVDAWIDGVPVISATPSVDFLVPNGHVISPTGDVDAASHAMYWHASAASSLPLTSTIVSAYTGYVGETATARILRICAEEGIPHTPWSPAPSDDIRLGPQPVGTVLDVLRDAELAGHGILYEDTSTWSLGYRPLESRYSQPPGLTVDLSTYRVTGSTGRDVLRPVRNDQRIRNEWTVGRPGGSEVTLADIAHQRKRGRYSDSAVVNVETDSQLVHEAGWRLREGTYEGTRYVTMPLDLAANPGLIGDWLALRPGDRIDRASHPAIHPAGPVSLTLEGYRAALRRRAWTVEATVEPYDTWDVGALADTPPAPGSARLQVADGTALASDVDADATQIEVDCAGWPLAELWVVDEADRSESGTWGTPDIGPQWVHMGSGGTPSVAGGDLIHAMTSDGDYLSSMVDGLALVDAQMYVRSARPDSTPSGDVARSVIYLRADGIDYVQAGIVWHTDGTADAFVGSSDMPEISVPIAGVSASEPVDLLALAYGDRLMVWAAPSSVGVDPWGPALLAVTVSVTGAGGVSLDTELVGGVSVPLTLRYGSIEVANPGAHSRSFPYRLVIGGEVMAVTHAIDRSGDVQTLAVQRGVNGVRKAHAAGAPVRIADPLVLAL